jgi:hypothetical protein
MDDVRMGGSMTTKRKPDPTTADLKRQVRELTRHLKDLTAGVEVFLVRLDVEMKGPSTEARGRRIAELTNRLDIANDSARYFGLGVDYRGDATHKTKVRRAAAEGEGSR